MRKQGASFSPKSNISKIAIHRKKKEKKETPRGKKP
jgi:hypothetical protein